MEATKGPQVKQVMLIDDTFEDLYVCNRIITKSGFAEKVIEFQSGIEALTYLKNKGEPIEVPEIIFLDIRMPGMDGFQFLHEYHKLDDRIKNKCRIYLLSSSIDPEDKRRAAENQYVTKFIVKPINKQNLLEILTAA